MAWGHDPIDGSRPTTIGITRKAMKVGDSGRAPIQFKMEPIQGHRLWTVGFVPFGTESAAPLQLAYATRSAVSVSAMVSKQQSHSQQRQ